MAYSRNLQTEQLRNAVGTPRRSFERSRERSDDGCHPASSAFNDEDQELSFDFSNPSNLVPVKALGEGVSGQVYLSVYRPTGRVYAKKTMTTTLEQDVFSKVLRELDINSRCVSPYITRYYGSFLEDEETVLSIVMEYCAGGSLQAISKQYHQHGVVQISEKVLASISFSVLSGLDYLHTQGVVHRDIKPSNVVLTQDGQTKLCDFGVSGVLVDSLAGTFTGTSLFMAPERLQGKPCGINGDVWSLGLTIYQVATGHNPYGVADDEMLAPLDIVMMAANDPVPTLPADTDRVKWTNYMRSFLKHTLVKDPAIRKPPKAMLKHPWIQLAHTPGMKESMARFVAGAWGWGAEGPPPAKIPDEQEGRQPKIQMCLNTPSNGPATLRPGQLSGQAALLIHTPTTARLRGRKASDAPRLGHSSTSSVSGSETETEGENAVPPPPLLTREEAALDLEPSPAPIRPQQRGRSKALAQGLIRLTIDNATTLSPAGGQSTALPQPVPPTGSDPLADATPIMPMRPIRAANRARPKLSLAPLGPSEQNAPPKPRLSLPALSLQVTAPSPDGSEDRPASPHSLAAARQREQALGLVGEGPEEEFDAPTLRAMQGLTLCNPHPSSSPDGNQPSNDEAYAI